MLLLDSIHFLIFHWLIDWLRFSGVSRCGQHFGGDQLLVHILHLLHVLARFPCNTVANVAHLTSKWHITSSDVFVTRAKPLGSWPTNRGVLERWQITCPTWWPEFKKKSPPKKTCLYKFDISGIELKWPRPIRSYKCIYSTSMSFYLLFFSRVKCIRCSKAFAIYKCARLYISVLMLFYFFAWFAVTLMYNNRCIELIKEFFENNRRGTNARWQRHRLLCWWINGRKANVYWWTAQVTQSIADYIFCPHIHHCWR